MKLTKETLDKIKQDRAAEMSMRNEQHHVGAKYGEAGGYRAQIMCCTGTGCASSKSWDIFAEFEKELKKHNIADQVKMVHTGCFGLCENGPIVIVYPDGAFYSHIKVEDVARIVEEHLVNGKVVMDLLYKESIAEDNSIRALDEVPFYRKQRRVALRLCGKINPEDINEYIANDGYQALAKCLNEYDGDQIVDILLRAGLRGRGGAGFPTGKKWLFAKNPVSDVKYVCCNADEGDPGAFMDRSVLEGDPHSVLEAMTIAGYCIGAQQGYIYVRAEYPVAVKRLRIAIAQAREAGLLGKNILGSDFSFDIDLRLGSGAFVCGEETALMASIEGQRGEPRTRPPFPAVKGLFGKPTLLNNVETYANVCQIILNGPEWFASMGTDNSKGTKVFALGGKINNTGLVEVPMGTTLREVIFEIGGGIPGGKKFKAAQTGGPSGGCIPAQHLDTPIDYNNLAAIGSMMGSGGMIVMDEDNCMVNIAKFFLEFTVDESCGKCPPCRIGMRRMLEMLTKITEGKGEDGDIEKLENLARNIQASALCGLGQTAPNPVLSTIRYFRDEYEAHIYEKRCPAGVCKALLNYTIDKDKCIGCGLCARNCPANAISKTDYVAPGKKLPAMEIDTAKCIKCGACIANCKFGAIERK